MGIPVCNLSFGRFEKYHVCDEDDCPSGKDADLSISESHRTAAHFSCRCCTFGLCCISVFLLPILFLLGWDSSTSGSSDLSSEVDMLAFS